MDFKQWKYVNRPTHTEQRLKWSFIIITLFRLYCSNQRKKVVSVCSYLFVGLSVIIEFCALLYIDTNSIRSVWLPEE